MTKTTKRVLSSLLLLMIFITTPAFAEESGSAVWTGSGNEGFETDAVHFSADELYVFKVTDYTTGKEMFLGDYLKSVVPEDEYPYVASSDHIFIQLHKTLTNEEYAFYVYPADGTPKDEKSWQSKWGNGTYNDIAKKLFNDANNELNGKLATGEYGSTILYSKMTKAGKEGTTPTPTPNPPKFIDLPKEVDYLVCDVGEGPRYKLSSVVDAGGEEITGVQAVLARVHSPTPLNFNSLTAKEKEDWINTHHVQSSQIVLTEYGKYLQANASVLKQLKELNVTGDTGENSNYRKLWEQFSAGAKAAIAKDLPDPSINLSESNQVGFGRGGVFTYTQMVKTATVETKHKQRLFTHYYCHNTYSTSYDFMGFDADDNPIYEENKKITSFYTVKEKNQVIDGQYTEKEVFSVVSNGYSPTQSYQMVGVKCNTDEFDKLVADTGSTVISKKAGHSVAKSPTVNGSVASYFNNLTTSFFYEGKSCSNLMSCSINGLENSKTDASTNKGDNGTIKGQFGAQAEGEISDKFTFFRDNVGRMIRNDVFAPDVSKLGTEWLLDINQGAFLTLVTLNNTGTPNGNLMQLNDKTNKKLLSGLDIQSGNNGLVLNGEHNQFIWQAQWASETDKPHGMNLKYAYKPVVSTVVPTTLTKSGIGSTTVWESPTIVTCDFKVNSIESDSHVYLTPSSEKSLTKDTTFDTRENYSLEVNFIKSSAE